MANSKADPIRLVLCDIDGTLYDWDRILSPRTIADINRLHEEGYGFGIASGRPYEELIHYAEDWGFSFPFDIIIGLNGAELYIERTKKLYSYYKLSRETLKKTMDVMSRFEANPFMYWHGKLLAVKMDAMIIKSSKTSQREIVIAKDPSELYAEENVKIMFRMSEEETARAEAWLAEHPDPDYAAFKTQSTLIEFMDPRLSKGFAIREMQKLGEYEPHEILAFGDTTNDNSMLEEAGWGVCLANGSDDTKACADDVTRYSCRDDGFADYLESWLFREESGKN
ncbi:MAG: HAD family phosphatase [Solobacterium sp.]|nr:HAD family phosphatase [Solobacterium sp.]